jgi:uncharacterized protein (DUF58 family)
VSAGAGVAAPAGRQGPGPIPAASVEALDLVMARRASGVLPGDRLAPGTGAGTELAQLRPYQPGDDVRRLDPAATARTGIPHVRLQVPERLLTTWIMLDISASMAFGTADRLKSDVAEGVALVIGRLGTRRGGRVALLTCGAPVERMLAPRGGRRSLALLRRVIAEGVAADGKPGGSLGDALARVGRMARHPGLVALISDFRGPGRWRGPLRRAAARHTVLAVEVRDPREGELPAVGRLALVDPKSGRQVEVDTSSQRLRAAYAERERERRDAVASELRRAGAEHVVLDTDGPWLRELGRRLA